MEMTILQSEIRTTLREGIYQTGVVRCVKSNPDDEIRCSLSFEGFPYILEENIGLYTSIFLEMMEKFQKEAHKLTQQMRKRNRGEEND